VVAVTIACAIPSSVTWSPLSSRTTCPREKITTRSQSPWSSSPSEEETSTGMPLSAILRRIR
jgi:hypothetical protein